MAPFVPSTDDEEGAPTVDVRVIELPAARMATTGPTPDPDPLAEGGLLTRFSDWFTRRVEALPLGPRDLMWFDEEAQALAWGYLLDPDEVDVPWDIVEFAGGLYASAVSRDPDDADGERVLAGMRAWVAASPFEVDETPERPLAFHITSPQAAADVLGYHQLELLLPLRLPVS